MNTSTWQAWRCPNKRKPRPSPPLEAANPDIRVERIRVQSNYLDRLIALIASGTAPDVIDLDMTYIMSFADERFLYDLAPLVQQTPSIQLNRIAPPILEVFTVDGKLFAIPSLANPSVYVFNTDLLNTPV